MKEYEKYYMKFDNNGQIFYLDYEDFDYLRESNKDWVLGVLTKGYEYHGRELMPIWRLTMKYEIVFNEKEKIRIYEPIKN